MTPLHDRLPRPMATVLAGMGVLILAACSTAQEAAEEAAEPGAGQHAGQECPVDVDDTFTDTVNVAFQAIPNGDLVVRDEGWLETCLPNATINWSQFASGGEVVQAFGSGTTDIGLVGSSPATKLISPPLEIDAQVVWIHDIIGDAESLVAQNGAQTVEGLAGATVAVPYGSTAHFSLLNALTDAGLDPTTDLTLINLSPDAMLGAWERGEIDAAWVWSPTLDVLLEDGTVILSSADTAEAGTATYDMAAATTAFIETNPQFLVTWTALQDEAVRVIQEEPERAAEAVAAQLGIDTSTAAEQMEGYVYLRAAEQAGAQYFGAALGEDLARTAQFLLDQREIAALAPPQVYERAVYIEAIDQVAS